MPYFSKESIEHEIEQQRIKKKIENKKLNQTINEKSKPPPDINKELLKLNKVKAEKPIKPDIIDPKDLIKQLKNDAVIKKHQEREIKKYVEANDMVELKNMAIALGSLPQKDPLKRELFRYKLAQSSIIGRYIDEQLLNFGMLNKHLQASIIYSLKFYETQKTNIIEKKNVQQDYINEFSRSVRKDQAQAERAGNEEATTDRRSEEGLTTNGNQVGESDEETGSTDSACSDN